MRNYFCVAKPLVLPNSNLDRAKTKIQDMYRSKNEQTEDKGRQFLNCGVLLDLLDFSHEYTAGAIKITAYVGDDADTAFSYFNEIIQLICRGECIYVTDDVVHSFEICTNEAKKLSRQ